MLVWKVSGSKLCQQTRCFEYVSQGCTNPGRQVAAGTHFLRWRWSGLKWHNIGIKFGENWSVFKGDPCRKVSDLVSVRFVFW
jgi:hypothetical protein